MSRAGAAPDSGLGQRSPMDPPTSQMPLPCRSSIPADLGIPGWVLASPSPWCASWPPAHAGLIQRLLQYRLRPTRELGELVLIAVIGHDPDEDTPSAPADPDDDRDVDLDGPLNLA